MRSVSAALDDTGTAFLTLSREDWEMPRGPVGEASRLRVQAVVLKQGGV